MRTDKIRKYLIPNIPYKAFNRFLHQFEPCRAYLLIHNSGA